MIVKVNNDEYILILPDVSVVFPDGKGLDIFVRRNGYWFTNNKTTSNSWTSPLLKENQIALESHFIIEKREQTINKLL